MAIKGLGKWRQLMSLFAIATVITIAIVQMHMHTVDVRGHVTLVEKSVHRDSRSYLINDKIISQLLSSSEPSAIEKKQGVVAEYCNLPETITLGSEGIAPAGYQLVSIQVITRHGTRVPIKSTLSFGPLRFPNIKCVLNVSQSPMPDDLRRFISKTQKFTRGINGWASLLKPQSEYCKPADLTQIGVEQHIKIGQLLREIYLDQLGNITQRNVQAVSSTKSRTYQSAIAFTFGLLNGNVRYENFWVARRHNNLFCTSPLNTTCGCQMADMYWKLGTKQLYRVKRWDPYYDAFNKSIHQSLGEKYTPIRSYYPWRTPHGIMVSKLCSKLKLYCTKENCFKETQADKNWQSLKFYHQQLSHNKNMISSAKLQMYHFLQELISRMVNHTNQTTTPQDTISIYSGHDNTIIPLLLALELPTKEWPPFASRLIFELYRPISDSLVENDYLFKVVYNGEDMTKHLHFCNRDSLKEKGGCPLNDLLKYYINILPRMGYYNYQQACIAR